MKTPNQRLKEARISAGYISASSFAENAGISVTTYRHHENGTGGRGIPARKLADYANALGVSVEWILTGRVRNVIDQSETTPGPQVSRVIRLSLSEIGELKFPIDITSLEQQSPDRERVLVPVAAANAAAMEMPDDSMSRMIPPHTEVLVDFDDTELQDGKPYLIKVGGTPIIRNFRIIHQTGLFEGNSFQSSIEPIPQSTIEHVLGRVVCTVTRF